MAEQDPQPSVLFVFGVGLGALAVLFAAALYSVGIDGKPDDVVIEWNGHLIGGPAEVFIARAIALVMGTAGGLRF